VAFFPADVSCISAVGTVPGGLEVIGRKTVFLQKFHAPSGNTGSRLPERGSVHTAVFQEPFPQQSDSERRCLLFKLPQCGNPGIDLGAALFELASVAVADSGVFIHNTVILFFF
jgi:hypothetical protein